MSREWTFLSNHGHVLVSLARDPDARMRDVADAVGITERAVQQIVHDLVEEGYLHKSKVGRRNRYSVVSNAHFRHDLESDLTVGPFLKLVNARSRPGNSNSGHQRSGKKVRQNPTGARRGSDVAGARAE